MSEIGDRIRHLRGQQGLGQDQLGFSAGYISLIENGERDPSMEATLGIANKLHITPLELSTGHNDVLCPWCNRKDDNVPGE